MMITSIFPCIVLSAAIHIFWLLFGSTNRNIFPVMKNDHNLGAPAQRMPKHAKEYGE